MRVLTPILMCGPRSQACNAPFIVAPQASCHVLRCNSHAWAQESGICQCNTPYLVAPQALFNMSASLTVLCSANFAISS